MKVPISKKEKTAIPQQIEKQNLHLTGSAIHFDIHLYAEWGQKVKIPKLTAEWNLNNSKNYSEIQNVLIFQIK